MNGSYILAIDQGTTSSRAIIYDESMRPVATSQKELTQHYPKPGWVEHDPEEILSGVLGSIRSALETAGLKIGDIRAIGIANQRETVVVWERGSGRAIHKAIVWQDRRTSAVCRRLKRDGAEKAVTARTGLLLDPYFSATKIAWILDHVRGARRRAERGELLAGTIDSWLIWRLTGGAVHATDATNASRTLLFDIERQRWDEGMLELFRVPQGLLPQVHDCASDFGTTSPDVVGAAIPILGVAGDQQAATIGQGCFRPGMLKATYGTGCFALLNTGQTRVRSRNRLLSTIAYQLDGQVTYALEGSIFSAGSTVQWLRDELGIIAHAAESGKRAAAADPKQRVYLVPAFTGLGAPYWEPDARGALFGLTRATGRNELARAALDAVVLQTSDLLAAMRRDWRGDGETVLRVDGGMAASDWTMQRLADVVDAPVERPEHLETTALGVAWLAGWKAGLYPDRNVMISKWKAYRRFDPAMRPGDRRMLLYGWRDAVSRTIGKEKGPPKRA